MSAARSVGNYLSIQIQKSDVLVSACEKKLAKIATLNGGHTHENIRFQKSKRLRRVHLARLTHISKVSLKTYTYLSI